VRNLRRPKLLIPPQAGAKQTVKELRAMRFRRRRFKGEEKQKPKT